eukprot:6644022-Ditylum_brightwellii.AAC.1
METIIEAKGHATGTPASMDSLRTKSISLLSILTYLHRFSIFYSIQANAENWIHICDNTTTVKRLQ